MINKHAPLKPLSKRKFKQSLKPWITKGLLKSIKIKNALFAEGDIDKYKYKYKSYRNKITTLIRQSKKLYYHTYFTQHIVVGLIKRLNGNGVTRNPAERPPNVLNDYFSTVGQKLAANVPDSNCHYREYLTNTNFTSSFFFEPVISSDIEQEISLLWSKKAYLNHTWIS